MNPHMNDLHLPRRHFLSQCGMGFGLSALAPLLSSSLLQGKGVNPMAPKGPHFAPKAKRVIHLFMNGGPSHMDTFDPKPELNKWHGKLLPEESRFKTERKTGAAFGSPFSFKRYGSRVCRSANFSLMWRNTPMTCASFDPCRRMYPTTNLP